MFLPKKDLDIIGEVCIRYEKHPWIEQFEFDGLRPRAPLRNGFGIKQTKAFAESLSKIYAKAYEDYSNMCSEGFISEENKDGLDVDAFFSNAAYYFVRNADLPETTPLLKKFCGFTENMWREGTETMHNVALKVILPIIENNTKALDVFYNTITPEFRRYIDENDYGNRIEVR